MMERRGSGPPRRGQRSTRWLLAFLTLILVVLAGCQRIDAGQAQTVRDYADALAPALHAETLDPLRQVATDDEVQRVQLEVMGILYKENQRMKARLARFEVESAKETGTDKAEVRTSEGWSITYTDSQTGKFIKRRDFDEKVRYELTRSNGRWYVSSLEIQ